MTTCPACSRPVAEGQTYHIQCDPYARIERLEKALRQFVEAHEDYCRQMCVEFDDPLSDAAQAARAELERKE